MAKYSLHWAGFVLQYKPSELLLHLGQHLAVSYETESTNPNAETEATWKLQHSYSSYALRHTQLPSATPAALLSSTLR